MAIDPQAFLDRDLPPARAELPVGAIGQGEARALSVLGSGLSGPIDPGTYRYPVGALQLRELLLDIVMRTFEPSRLVLSATEKTTG